MLVSLRLQIVFENRTLTNDRAFYVPGVQEESWNKVRSATRSLVLSNAADVAQNRWTQELLASVG